MTKKSYLELFDRKCLIMKGIANDTGYSIAKYRYNLVNYIFRLKYKIAITNVLLKYKEVLNSYIDNKIGFDKLVKDVPVPLTFFTCDLHRRKGRVVTSKHKQAILKSDCIKLIEYIDICIKAEV